MDHVNKKNISCFLIDGSNFKQAFFTFAGIEIRVLGESKLPSLCIPLLLYNGELFYETSNGKISHLLLSTHQVSASLVKKDQNSSLEESFKKLLQLLR